MKYIKFRAKAVHPKYKGLYLTGYGILFENTSAWIRYKENWIEISRKTIEILETEKWGE